MIKKLFTKYILEVVPSIVATVVGAYIVTHYINAKSDADKPKTEAAAPADTSKIVAPQTLKSDDAAADKAAKADAAKADAAKADAAKAKADKVAADKAAAERAASDRAEAAAKKTAADKLASDKAASEKRDANDLARAAIERLRSAEPKTESKAEAKAETPRAPDNARVNSVVYAPAAAPQPVVQPLPPAVTVAPQPSEIHVSQPKSVEARADESFRPTPPANIPSRPLDIRAHERERSVGESVVSAAKSVFQAVIPDSSN